MSESVTRILQELQAGDSSGLPVVAEAVQRELRDLAAHHLARERRDHTLQPTALVNEAYLKLVEQRSRNWESKKHFLAIASLAMRRVLLEHARARRAERRGGGLKRVTLFDAPTALHEEPDAILALDEALVAFAEIDPENARIVELRFFAGLEVADVAALLDVSQRTVERGWRAAQAWLRDRLERAQAD